MRYFIQFSYFGKAYHGWQAQPNAVTVQEVLQQTMSTLLRTNINLVGAGRTDAGVHAKQLFAHFDVQRALEIRETVQKLNSFLPSDIAVQRVFQVMPEAHARFDAIARTYEYHVVQEKNPFLTDYAHFVWLPLDMEAMNRAASILMEYEDFESFSRSQTDVQTYLCNLSHAQWQLKTESLVFTITANRFLRNMVRAIVGTLLPIGLGKTSVESIRTVIEGKDRGAAGPSAPAKGLYLTEVSYPENIII